MRNLFTIILVTLLICSCDFSSDSVNDANDVLSTEESIKEMASEYGLHVTINKDELQRCASVNLDSIKMCFQALSAIKQVKKIKVTKTKNGYKAKEIIPVHPVSASGHTEMYDFHSTPFNNTMVDGFIGYCSLMWYYLDDTHQVINISGNASVVYSGHYNSELPQHYEFTTLKQYGNSNAVTFSGKIELESRKYLNVTFYFHGYCSNKEGEIHWS